MKIDITNCSWEKLVMLAIKCRFNTCEGGNHTRVEDKDGKLITTIPRNNRVKKYTAQAIIREFKRAGCKRKEIEGI